MSAQNRLDDAERALEIIQSGRLQANAESIQSELDANEYRVGRVA